jgi:hypothetical protein
MHGSDSVTCRLQVMREVNNSSLGEQHAETPYPCMQGCESVKLLAPVLEADETEQTEMQHL